MELYSYAWNDLYRTQRCSCAFHLPCPWSHEPSVMLLQCTEYIMSLRVDATATNNDGNTAMHLAAQESSLSTLLVLATSQPLSDRQLKNNKGETVVRVHRLLPDP